jgi:hypothetical protein
MRIIELKLFHHYTTITSTLMPRYGLDALDHLFRMHVPQLCFLNNALLSSVLGLAAVDFLALNPDNQDMKRAARFYLNQTITQQCRLVSNVSKENAEAVTLVAMFLAMQIRHRAAFVSPDEPYKLPLQLFYMTFGIIVISSKCIPLLRASNVPIVFGIRPAKFVVGFSAKYFLPCSIWEDSLLLREGLDAEGFDPKIKSVYDRALAYIEEIYIALLREEAPEWIRRRHSGFLVIVPRGFVKLLEQQDPRAMAILARYMALMKMCDKFCYCTGTAEYEVQGILSLMPQAWLWAMEWPLRILKLNKLVDCEIQQNEPEPEWMDDPSLGMLDINPDDDLNLEMPSNSGISSLDMMMPSSTHYPRAPRISGSFGWSVRSRTSGSVQRCLELRPAEEQKLLLEVDEILALPVIQNHIASGMK